MLLWYACTCTCNWQTRKLDFSLKLLTEVWKNKRLYCVHFLLDISSKSYHYNMLCFCQKKCTCTYQVYLSSLSYLSKFSYVKLDINGIYFGFIFRDLLRFQLKKKCLRVMFWCLVYLRLKLSLVPLFCI